MSNKLTTVEEIASNPHLMKWLSQQVEFAEAMQHAEAIAKANPWINPEEKVSNSLKPETFESDEKK